MMMMLRCFSDDGVRVRVDITRRERVVDASLMLLITADTLITLRCRRHMPRAADVTPCHARRQRVDVDDAAMLLPLRIGCRHAAYGYG